jgi:hypothetical protein
VNTFFYGLFMDADALREEGLHPRDVRRASVKGMALRIGARATLIPEPSGRVHGVVMTLSHSELDRLYAKPSVSGYRPEPVIVDLEDGSSRPALCFNLPTPPALHETNTEYSAKLRALAQRLRLPKDYIERIR